MTVWTVLGSFAALLTMFGFVPQLVKIYRTRSVQDISLISLVQFCFGISLWVVYGMYLHNPIIILANAVSLSTLVATLALYFQCRKKG